MRVLHHLARQIVTNPVEGPYEDDEEEWEYDIEEPHPAEFS